MSTTLDHKVPCTNTSCQLGWGVHNFGPQSPMYKHMMPVGLGCPQLWTTKPHVQTYHASWAGMSTTLIHKARCTNIACKLGRDVHYFGPQSPMYKHIMPVGLGCPLLWTTKSHVQTYHASLAGVSTTLDHKAPCTNISCQFGWGVHYFGPQSPMYKHIMPVGLGCPLLWTTKSHVQTYHASLAGLSTTLDHKAPCTNISCQLGWGVHYFGPQSPMYKHIMLVGLGCPQLWTTKSHVQIYHASWAGVSTTLDHKAPCTNISCQLGWGVHYFGPQSPMYKHIMPVGLGCPLLWTTKPHVQTYHASLAGMSTTLDHKARCTNIACKLGRDVHYFEPQNPIDKQITPAK